MPKVIAPLYSLSASGTLGKTLTYSITTQNLQVRFHNAHPRKRSVLQIAHGYRVADCRASWRALSPASKAPWIAAGIWSHLTGPALYFREWFAQNIYPPNQPAVPV